MNQQIPFSANNEIRLRQNNKLARTDFGNEIADVVNRHQRIPRTGQLLDDLVPQSSNLLTPVRTKVTTATASLTGDATTQCGYRYDVYQLDNTTLIQADVEVVDRGNRASIGAYVAGEDGDLFTDNDGTKKLKNVTEKLNPEACSGPASQSANFVFSGPVSGSAAAPTFRAMVPADLPLPTSTTVGGVKSLASVSHNFLTSIGTDGSVTQAQPAAGDITGLATVATTGAATDLTGTLGPTHGGTGVGTLGGTNTILYTSAANTLSSITTANSGVLVTSGAGVPSISTTLPAVNGSAVTALNAANISTGTLAVARGGTAVATFGGTNTILYTTAADTLASLTTANSAVLVTNGSGVPSLSTTLPAVNGAAVTALSAANVSTGTLAVARGGTGVSTFGGTNKLLYTSATDTLTSLVTANSSVLITNGSGVPSWGTTLPAVNGSAVTNLNASNVASGTLAVANGGTGLAALGGTNTLLYTSTTSTVSSIATANSSVLITSSGGVPSWSTTLPAVNGSALTNLTAANITGSHTLPDGVLSTNVFLLNANQTVTGTTTFSAATTFSAGIITTQVKGTSTTTHLDSYITFPSTQNRNDITGTLGHSFTPNKYILVTQLGRHYGSNTGNHGVNIWQDGSSVSAIGSVTVLAATASDANGYKFATLGTPVLLSPGVTYRIATDETASGDQWYDAHTLTGIINTTDLTAVNACYQTSGPGVYPANDIFAGFSYSTPRMKYDYTTPATVIVGNAAGDATDIKGNITLRPQGAAPAAPSSSSEGNVYIKGGKLIIQYNDAGTTRYKYLDLTSTGVTWVHTTTAP